MNWCPLDNSNIENISKLIDYSGKDMKTSELYRKISDIPYCIENKIKFILWHWGWNGELKKDGILKTKEFIELGFYFPDNIYSCITNLYGLKIETLTQSNLGIVYDGILVFELPSFINNDDLDYNIIFAEVLGVKYQDTIMPIGRYINKYRDDNIVFLGKKGEIYEIDPAYSEYSEIVAKNLLDYLAIRFGLQIWREDKRLIGTLSEEEYDILDQIDELFSQCEYKQGQFQKRSVSHH